MTKQVFPGTFRVLLVLCWMMVEPSRAFRAAVHHTRQQVWQLRGAQSDDDDDNPPLFPAGFNPLQYNASVNNRATAPSSTVLSLRQTQMKQVMADLLLHVNDPVALQSILNKHVDFLLEPILDGDCCVQDGIYRNCRTTAERFAAFDAQLEQRLERARDASVQTVLTALREFVLEQQQQQHWNE